MHFRGAERKDGDGGSETKESDIDISQQPLLAEWSLGPILSSNLALGKQVTDLPALNLEALICIEEGGHSGLLIDGVIVIF